MKVIRLSDFERNGANEVEERAFVERVIDGFPDRRLLPRALDVGALVRHDLVMLGTLTRSFLDLPLERERVHGDGVDPALVHIVHPIERHSTLNVERGVPRFPSSKCLACDHCERAAADAQSAEADLESGFLPDTKWNLASVSGSRRRRPGAGRRERQILLSRGVTRYEKRKTRYGRFQVPERHDVTRSFARSPPARVPDFSASAGCEGRATRFPFMPRPNL